MSTDEGTSSNITRTLSNIFEEMLMVMDDDGQNRSNVYLTNFLTTLKDHLPKNSSNEPLDFEMLMKLVGSFRSKLNLTKPTDYTCGYCEGGIRDVILAYNSIHGYISLIGRSVYTWLRCHEEGGDEALRDRPRGARGRATTEAEDAAIVASHSQDPFHPTRDTATHYRVCFFGSLANALNVAVLTRRDLAAAPINRLLKWLAVADVFVMMEYVPFAIYRYLILPGQQEMPYKWAAYLLFHMHFAQIFHTASICLTISLAVWRYVAIKYSDRSHILCTERRCSTAILISFLLPPILCIPTFMVFDIHTAVVFEQSRPMILYHVDSDEEGQLYKMNFWVHAVVIKLLPCIILTVISLWLINEVYSANQHQKKVRVYTACPTNNKMIKRQYKADKRTDRTTKMLVAVLLLFLVTELPQGILGLLSGLLGRCFFKRCYDLFGELMDALALLNGAINFVLYCSMSRQFRMTFGLMMGRANLHRWPPPTASHSDGQNTAKTSIP